VKAIINGLNKVFDSRVRLGIMSALAVNESVDFSALKDYLELTDGNLASHLKALEKEEYIETRKSFVGRKPNTKFCMTKQGKIAFEAHINALEKLIRSQK
jgi:DNA-binding MarR family transcriptional regulator